MTFAVDWSLIFFTVFAQAAFGMLFALLFLSAAKQPAARIVYGKMRTGVAGVAILLMLAALFFSFFHLGSPARAVYALSNLGHSWLSREILMVLVFLIVLLIWFAGMKWRLFNETANSFMLILAVVSGALMVFAMARLYMLPAVPAWDSPRTVVLFYSSGILTGTMLLLAMVIPSLNGRNDRPASCRFVPVLLLAGAAAMVFRTGFSLLPLPVDNVAFAPEKIPLLLSGLNILLPLAGIVAGSVSILFPPLCGEEKCNRWRVLSLILIFAGEITGRYIFYSGYFSAGI